MKLLTIAQPDRMLKTIRILVVALVVSAVLGWGGVLGGRQIWAYYHFHAAEASLERWRLNEARDHLNQCLKWWPEDTSTLLLAVRVARLAEDYDEAEQYLGKLEGIKGVSDISSLEWAMLRAHYGDLDSVETYLQSLLAEGHPNSSFILDALIAGYGRMYRNSEALRLIDYWLKNQPDCPQALYYRGRTKQRLHNYQSAADDFAQVLQADPDRDNVRLWLANCLLEVNDSEKALEHMKRLYKKHPDEPEIVVVLANCHNNLGDFEEGMRLLDALLVKHPDYAPALIGRGQIALQMRQANKALSYLQRAVELTPIDFRANYELYHCLQQLGLEDEAKKQNEKVVSLQKNIERLIQISNHEMAKRPNDRALLTELGNLMIELSQEDLGERWLLTALRKDPNYGPAHEALAKLYEKKGEPDKASVHRQKALKALARPEENRDKKTN
jgi:tetratricopeptide (TPR) repeat protein